MPRRSPGVDGVGDGKPPGARRGIQILGMVRGEWLRLVPPGARGESGLLGHCWHLASPRRVSGSQVVVRVLMLAWIFAFVVFRALAAPTAVVMVAESGFFNFLASVRELAALTAGYFFRGCRIGCRSLRVCAAVLGSFWSGASHPPA